MATSLRNYRDNAWANFEAAVNRTTDSLKEQISALSEAAEAHKKLGETLKNAVMELRNEVASTSEWSAARGMVYIEDALSKVRSGSDTLDFKDLEDAIAAARGGISKGAYVSQFDRDRDALVLAGQHEELGELNGEQLSTEEKQLRILRDQLEYYEAYLQSARDMVNGVNTLIDKTLSPEQAYEILLRAMRDRDDPAKIKEDTILNAIKGLEGQGGILSHSADTVKSLWYALTAVGGTKEDLHKYYGWEIKDIETALRNAGIQVASGSQSGANKSKITFGGGSSGGSDSSSNGAGTGSAAADYHRRAMAMVLGNAQAISQEKAIKDAAAGLEGLGGVLAHDAQTISGLWQAVSSAGGNQYDLQRYYGWDAGDIEAALKNAGVPGFSQGINVVPHDMFAQIHEGEAIIPKRYNPFNPGHVSTPGGVGNELVSELRSLHETIYELKAEVAQLKGAAVRTAKNTEGVPQLVDQFDEVTEGGNVLRTEVV